MNLNIKNYFFDIIDTVDMDVFFRFSICFTFCFLFLFSCSSRHSESTLTEGPPYVVDLDGKQELSIPLSTYFRNAKIIPLETRKDCMIGRISSLQVFDGYVYVLDSHVARSMFVFDIDGRFVKKIGSVGRGPGEYTKINDFTLDTKNQFIYLLDFGQRIHKYSFDGTYLQTITPMIHKTNAIFIQYYNGRLYLSIRAWTPKPDDYMLLSIDPLDGKVLSSSLSYKYNKGWNKLFFTGHSFFMSRLNSPPLYAQLFMDYVVTVDENIVPYIELKSRNLVKHSDLEGFINDNSYSDNFREDFRERSKIWDVHDYVENDEFFMFRYRTGFRVFNTAIYDKRSGDVKLVRSLDNDLVFKENDKNQIYRKFVFSDKNCAYEILEGVILDDFLESIKNDELIPDLDKIDDLIKLSKSNLEPNPIIIYYEFK